MSILRYGTDSSVQLDFGQCTLLAECGNGEAGAPLDLADAVRQALAEPVGIPALAQCITPSDQITIALEEAVPQGEEIAAQVVNHLIESGVTADGIIVLRSAADVAAGRGNPLPLLSEDLQNRIRLVDHDPNDQQALAFLATAKSGDPVWLNRVLTDADMVLPIGSIHGRAVPGHFGIHTAIYPTFADQATQTRFCSPQTIGDRGRHRRKLVEAVDEIGWLLGIMFTIQVVPVTGDRAMHLVAGATEETCRRARALYRKAWRFDVDQRAGIVVAGIEGDRRRQTWQNLARSLVAASECVEDGGAIVVCCDLEDEPGEAVDRLRRCRSSEEALGEITEQPTPDALVAAQLVRSLERVDLYLRSGLGRDLLEDLMIAPVESDDEVNRLVNRFPTAIVLGNAPQTIVRVVSD